MKREIDPEILTMQRIERLLGKLTDAQRTRVMEWIVSRERERRGVKFPTPVVLTEVP